MTVESVQTTQATTKHRTFTSGGTPHALISLNQKGIRMLGTELTELQGSEDGTEGRVTRIGRVFGDSGTATTGNTISNVQLAEKQLRTFKTFALPGSIESGKAIRQGPAAHRGRPTGGPPGA